MRGQVAHVPHTIVTPFSYDGGSNANTPTTPPEGDVFNNPVYMQQKSAGMGKNGNRTGNVNVLQHKFNLTAKKT